MFSTGALPSPEVKQELFQPTAAVVSSDFSPLPRRGRPPRSWDRDVTMPEGMGYCKGTSAPLFIYCLGFCIHVICFSFSIIKHPGTRTLY